MSERGFRLGGTLAAILFAAFLTGCATPPTDPADKADFLALIRAFRRLLFNEMSDISVVGSWENPAPEKSFAPGDRAPDFSVKHALSLNPRDIHSGAEPDARSTPDLYITPSGAPARLACPY